MRIWVYVGGVLDKTRTHAASPDAARALAKSLVREHHPPMTSVYWQNAPEQGYAYDGSLVWHSPGNWPMSGEALVTDPAETSLIRSGKAEG